MVKVSELHDKEIINLYDGATLGHIVDIDLDPKTGYILAVQAAPAKIFSLFSETSELEIPWQDILKIGTDYIFVDDKKFSRIS